MIVNIVYVSIINVFYKYESKMTWNERIVEKLMKSEVKI